MDENNVPYRQQLKPSKQETASAGARSADVEATSSAEWIDIYIHQRIDTAVKEKLEDTSIVNQLAANSVEKVMQWLRPWQTIAKWMISIVSSVLLIALACLGYIGIKSWSDIERTIHSKVREIVATEHLKSQELVKQFENKLQDYRGRVDKRIVGLNLDMASVKSEVDMLREKAKVFEFLNEFREYLKGLGFSRDQMAPSVVVNKEYKHIAHFDPSRNAICLGPYSCQDKDVVGRHYIHSQLRHYRVLARVESGLADYFSCSYGDDSKFGEVYARLSTRQGEPPECMRNLNNAKSLSDLSNEGRPIEVGEVWGGAFWEIRSRLGKLNADLLIMKAVLSFTPDLGGPADESKFVTTLVEEVRQAMGHEDAKEVMAIFTKRGIVLRANGPDKAKQD